MAADNGVSADDHVARLLPSMGTQGGRHVSVQHARNSRRASVTLVALPPQSAQVCGSSRRCARLVEADVAIASLQAQYADATDSQFLASREQPMISGPHNGIISTSSHHSVDQTVETLQTILRSRGLTVFAVVDHSGEAEKVGLRMPPTKLLIFGSPKAGTPVMLAAPSTAIDLPLKILVWQDAGGHVWMSYNSPDYLRERHGIPPELVGNIAVVEKLTANAAK